jgi:GlpG protein
LNRFGGYRAGPFTFFLMASSILVALISQLGSNTDAIQLLFITEYDITGSTMRWTGGLPEIRDGQIWRVFTPMFIHFGILHVAFNMMWLFQLGSLIENRQGTLFFALLVLTISGGSNLAQYFVSGPSFGGMSGVVFGLFGYIWTKMKFDPLSGYFIDPTTVMWMIAWFFICLTGMVGHIANTVHAVGLVLGMLWGFLNSKYRRL